MKSVLTILLFAISFFTFGQTLNKYGKHADSLNSIGQGDKVLPYLENELKKSPKEVEILKALGVYYIQNNQLDLGEKCYYDALKINPKCATCYAHIARIYAMKNDFKKAMELVNKCITIDPNESYGYFLRAQLKDIKEDKFGALIDYNKAIELEPSNADYYNVRSNYNLRQGYKSLALNDLNKAIELIPDNYELYFSRAKIYSDLNLINETLMDINKAIELDSNVSSLYSARGFVHGQLSKFDNAMADFAKAINLNPKDFQPYINRAHIYFSMEDMDASCADYEILRSFIKDSTINDSANIRKIQLEYEDFCDSTKASYYYQRGVAYYNLKKYQNAVDIYSKGLVKFPTDATTLSFKGNALMALGNYKDAIDCYNKSLLYKESIFPEIFKNPRFADASKETLTKFFNGSMSSVRYSLAECYLYLGILNDALIEINLAFDLAIGVSEIGIERYHNLRGLIFLSMQKYNQALNEFNTSIQINPKLQMAYVNRAIARMCIIDKVKINSLYIGSTINNQLINIDWILPQKSLKKSTEIIQNAIADCNKAIEIDKSYGNAYYIRGLIKKALQQPDYCLDLFTAKELGLNIAPELIIDCSQ